MEQKVEIEYGRYILFEKQKVKSSIFGIFSAYQIKLTKKRLA